MKEIPLTKGYVAIVDDEDYKYLIHWKWCASSNNNKTFYAKRTSLDTKKTVAMHRVIMNPPEGMQVDHIDGNTLNNQKSNLRICTQAENQRNRPKLTNNTSGYKGVTKAGKKYQAAIKVNRKTIILGYYSDIEDAREAYKQGAIKYHGEFARYD